MKNKKLLSLILSSLLLLQSGIKTSALSFSIPKSEIKHINYPIYSVEENTDTDSEILSKPINEDLSLTEDLGNDTSYETLLIPKDKTITIDTNGFNVYGTTSNTPVIYVDEGAVLNIINSSGTASNIGNTENNTLVSNVTGIYAKAGAQVTVNGKINISNCLIGIHSSCDSITLSDDVKITKNTSDITGAAVILSSGKLIMGTNTEIFENNNTNGAIIADENTEISNGYIHNNTSDYGAAIHVLGKNVKIDGTVIEHNTAYKNGGGIYVSKNASAEINAKVNNNIAKKENGKSFGGGIYLSENSSVTLSGTVKSNYASTNGGGICLANGASAEISAEISNNIAQAGGGLMLSNNNTVTITSSVSSNNSNIGGGIYLNNSNLTTSDSAKFLLNTAADSGGAINAVGRSVLNISGEFSNNIADYGGAIYLKEGDSINEAVNFTTKAVYNENTAYSNGGAIFAAGLMSLDLSNSTFSKNSANMFGGAVCANFSQASVGNLQLKSDSSSFSENTATSGAGLFLYKNATANITNTSFSNNKSEKGAGITMYDCNVTLDENTSFTENESTIYGAAVTTEGTTANLQINNSIFSSNKAPSAPAVNAAKGKIVLNGGSFENNTFETSGPICIYTTSFSISDNIIFKDNVNSEGQPNCFFLGVSNITNRTATLNIAGQLTNTEKYIISTSAQPTYVNPITITINWKSYMSDSDPADYFEVLNEDHLIVYMNDEAVYTPQYVEGTSIILNYSKLNLFIGQQSTITARVEPFDASITTVTYESSNPDVLTVSNIGLITAVEAGEAIITIKTTDGKLTAECIVTVTPSDFHHDNLWTELNNSSSREITKSGSYYLTEDINIEKENPIVITAKNVTLCLNGYKINNSSEKGASVVVGENSHLNISDCTYTSVISGGEYGLKLSKNSSVEFNDITISGTSLAGVYASDAKFIMNSGIISDNNGFGIYIEDSEKNDSFGGLYLNSGSIMNNNNSGIYAFSGENADSMVLNIGSVNIIKNIAEKGAGMYIGKSFKAVVSANIQDNTSTSGGAGIYLENGSKSLTLASGKYTIYNNLSNNAQSNILLPENCIIAFTEAYPNENSKIGISTVTSPGENGIKITDVLTDYNNNVIVADNPLFKITLSADKALVLVSTVSSNFIFGDVNCDGNVNMIDVTTLQRILASLDNYSDFGSTSKLAADVNHDGNVSMLDVTDIQRFIAKLINSF